MDVVDTPLTQDMQPCFFSLLKDLLHQAPDQQLSLTQLESGVMIWQESPIAALNPWYNTLSDWRSSIGSALAFLVSGPTQHHPVNFSQMIYQDSSTGKYSRTTCIDINIQSIENLSFGRGHLSDDEHIIEFKKLTKLGL